MERILWLPVWFPAYQSSCEEWSTPLGKNWFPEGAYSYLKSRPLFRKGQETFLMELSPQKVYQFPLNESLTWCCLFVWECFISSQRYLFGTGKRWYMYVQCDAGVLLRRIITKACPVNVWLGKLTVLDMIPLGWLGCKISTQTNNSHFSDLPECSYTT